MKTNLFIWKLGWLMASMFPLLAQQPDNSNPDGLLALAETGNAKAQCDLGSMYRKGGGVTRDYYKAIVWFDAAAEQSFAEAQFDLGDIFDRGEGVAQNYEAAVKWYRKAADQGNVNAQLSLGIKYAAGRGVAQDYTESAEWSRRAAEQGYASAQLFLGQLYSNGSGVPHDNVEAYKWITLCASQDARYSPDPTYCKRYLSSLESVMTPEQIAKASRLALEFKPRKEHESGELTSIIPTPAKPSVKCPSSAEPEQASKTTPPCDTNERNTEQRQYTEQQWREMVLSTPFFTLPKAVQDNYISQIRTLAKKQRLEMSDAVIIQTYYKQQRMAQPPPDVQQYYRNHYTNLEANKLDSREMFLTTPFFDLPK